FDSLDRTELKKMLEVRVADGSLLRLIGKCLHVGVLDGETMVEPELGTAQGAVLSPLLGNVYLHYGLDLWFETEVKPRLQGKATLIRMALPASQAAVAKRARACCRGTLRRGHGLGRRLHARGS